MTDDYDDPPSPGRVLSDTINKAMDEAGWDDPEPYDVERSKSNGLPSGGSARNGFASQFFAGDVEEPVDERDDRSASFGYRPDLLSLIRDRRRPSADGT